MIHGVPEIPPSQSFSEAELEELRIHSSIDRSDVQSMQKAVVWVHVGVFLREQLMLCRFWFNMSVNPFVKAGTDTT